jgi:hypothetical protein
MVPVYVEGKKIVSITTPKSQNALCKYINSCMVQLLQAKMFEESYQNVQRKRNCKGLSKRGIGYILRALGSSN